MGCSTCKGKNSKEENIGGSNTETINLIPESFQNGDFSGNFVLKLLAFVILIIGWPLITLAIFYIVFVNFFIKNRNGNKDVGSMFDKIFQKYAEFKVKRIMKKREREFTKNRDYSGDSELTNIEVFESEENNEDVDK